MPWLHHTFIHFVIGFAAVIPFLAVAKLRRAEPWTADLRLAIYVAAVAAVIAVVTGLASATHAVRGGLDASRVALHRNLALPAAVLLWSTAALAARKDRRAERIATIVSALAAVMVAVAAHVAGDMLHPGLSPWSTEPHVHGHDHGAAPPPPASHAHPEGAHEH